MNFFAQLFAAVTELIAPPWCASCREMLPVRNVLCAACQARIQPMIPIRIALTKSQQMVVYACGAYEEPLAALIRAKHQRNPVAARQLGQLVAEYVRGVSRPYDYLVPVPLHWRRYAWRGFNQAALMADVIASVHTVPVADLLQRSRATAYQTRSDAHQRAVNVVGAFALRTNVHRDEGRRYRGKHLLIVDDVMTTGATLQAVGRELARLQPASITAVVAARTRAL